MNKTRIFMIIVVILLSLGLVGMALAADSLPQKENPPISEPDTSEVEEELQAEATYPRLVSSPAEPKAPAVLLDAVIYYSDFETDNGGLTSTLDWTWGTYTWNGATCDSLYYPPPSAYSGTHMWGTRLNTCYQNLGNNEGYITCTNTNPANDSILTLTVDLTGYSEATLSYWEWYDLYSRWDWSEVYANGTPILQHCEPSFIQPITWTQRVIDLTPYADGSLTLEFHMMASAVVNHAGWFIDNLEITGIEAPPDVEISPLSLHATQVPDIISTQPITVCNTGGMPLNWVLYEVPDLSSTSATVDNPAASEPSQPVELTLDNTLPPDLPQGFVLDLNDVESFIQPNHAELIWKREGTNEPVTMAPAVPEGVTALLLDDGGEDELWGFYFRGEGLIFLNRFTPDPSDFPLQLNEVRIFGVPISDEFDLVIYQNTTGGPDPAPGSDLVYTSTVTIQESDAWNIYPLDPPLTFYGPGDILVGVRPHVGADGWTWWLNWVDITGTQNRSWWGWYSDDPPVEPPLLPPDFGWDLWGSEPGLTPGNWMFRAYGEAIGTNIPWLKEHPIHGPTAEGECTVINIKFDSNGLGHGDYTGSLQVNSNDPDETTITVPVTLTVIAPEIEVTPLALESFQPPDALTNQPLEICNTGNVTLTWTLAEFPKILVANSGSVSGIGEWLYRDEEGIILTGNGASETLVHPAAYQWSPATSSAMKILILSDDFYHPPPNTYLDQALQHLGLPYTAYYFDFPGFTSALTSGTPWDLVLIANSATNDPNWMASVNTYIQNGGKAIIHTYLMSEYNYADAPLWTTMGVDTFVHDLYPPEPVYWWEPSHPFFTIPMSVPEFTDLIPELWIVNGQHIQPMPGFEALAGYTTPGPDTGEAALILGNDNRTVFKGFIDGQNVADLDSDSMLDSVELWIDLINGILFGITGDLPWLSENPIHGSVLAGACMAPPLAITFDSTGLALGEYLGDLQVNSNDPFVPEITLPITLTVKNYELFLPLTIRR